MTTKIPPKKSINKKNIFLASFFCSYVVSVRIEDSSFNRFALNGIQRDFFRGDFIRLPLKHGGFGASNWNEHFLNHFCVGYLLLYLSKYRSQMYPSTRISMTSFELVVLGKHFCQFRKWPCLLSQSGQFTWTTNFLMNYYWNDEIVFAFVLNFVIHLHLETQISDKM